jgi:hypothetical protein
MFGRISVKTKRKKWLMDEDFNDSLKIRTGRIDIKPFPRPLYTSKDRLSPFLFSRVDIAPYAFILAFRDLEP